jgi:hypothetical protein
MHERALWLLAARLHERIRLGKRHGVKPALPPSADAAMVAPRAGHRLHSRNARSHMAGTRALPQDHNICVYWQPG